MGSFREIAPTDISGNAIQKISKEWMLLAAEKENRVNMMTASWGGMGFLWNKPVSFAFFRPQRYTLEFINAAETYSMTFFDESFRSKLNLCGTKSGRDIDKITECGFDVLSCEGTPYFEQAKLAVICKKLYVQRLESGCFIDSSINAANYPQNDHHYMFVGEIIKVLEK